MSTIAIAYLSNLTKSIPTHGKQTARSKIKETCIVCSGVSKNDSDLLGSVFSLSGLAFPWQSRSSDFSDVIAVKKKMAGNKAEGKRTRMWKEGGSSREEVLRGEARLLTWI